MQANDARDEAAAIHSTLGGDFYAGKVIDDQTIGVLLIDGGGHGVQALAIGTLNLPVSPETQTWGAIASVATGIGTVLNRIGELRNE